MEAISKTEYSLSAQIAEYISRHNFPKSPPTKEITSQEFQEELNQYFIKEINKIEEVQKGKENLENRAQNNDGNIRKKVSKILKQKSGMKIPLKKVGGLIDETI